jgi:phospholipase/carboxylesterase
LNENKGPVVAWRRPAKRGPNTPLVVMLHGLGADEHDLIDIAASLSPSFAYASVRGPLDWPAEGGYTWFRDRGIARPIAASLRESIAWLRAWLDGPEVAAYNHERTYVLGFSAGMIMAGALVLDDPKRFAGAVLLSGVLAFDAGVDTSKERLAGVPVFLGSGAADTVVPAELAKRSALYLRTASGAALTERTYSHGHAISKSELADIRAWFDAL